MGRDRAVGFEIRRKDLRQKGLRDVHHGDRQGSPFSIPRSSRAQSSSPSVQQVTLAVLAYQLAQFKKFPVQLSRSVICYPYRWLGATWAISVLVGSIAAITLLRIDPVELEPSIATPPPEQSLSAQLQDERQNHPKDNLSQERQVEFLEQSGVSDPKQKSSLPLFALGTVAFSCAIGCLLLSYRLTSHQPKPQPRLPTRPQRLPRTSSAPAHTQTHNQQTIRTVEPTVKETRSNSSEAPFGATVAIVSSDESHPLDWDEPSLADHLDIRQRRPLSHWL